MTISKDSILYKLFGLTHILHICELVPPLKKLFGYEDYDYHTAIPNNTSICVMFWRIVGLPLWFVCFTIFSIFLLAIILPIGTILEKIEARKLARREEEIKAIQEKYEVAYYKARDMYYEGATAKMGFRDLVGQYFLAVKKRMCPLVTFKEANENK